MPRPSTCFGCLVLVTSVACGDDPPASPPGLRDGARLAARYWDAGDGARLLRAWFDRELATECQFFQTPDDRYRCLPTGETTTSLGGTYADASCTQPAVLWPSCAPPLTAVLSLDEPTASCAVAHARTVFRVGAETTTLFRRIDTSCEPETIPAGQRAFRVGAARDPGEFVGADLVVQGDGRLAPFALQADDGTVEIVSIWDTERDAECGGREGDDGGPLRCAPLEIALHYDFLWSDDTCTVHAAADLSPYRPCFPVAAVADFGGRGLLEVGARLPDGQVHRTDSAGVCAPETTPLADAFYLEGPPILPEALAEVVNVLDGTGRIRAARVADATGRPLARAEALYDTTLASGCGPARFPDGLRCAPVGASEVGGRYADPACTSPLVTWAPPVPPVLLKRHTATTACDAIEFDGAYEVGDAFIGAEVFVRDGTGNCVAVPRGPDDADHALGAPLELPRLRAP